MKDVTYEIPFLGLYQTRNLDWIPNRKKKSSENINNNNSKVSLRKKKNLLTNTNVDGKLSQ